MNFIVDGLNIAFRAHHVYDVVRGLKTSTGVPTGMVYGFLKIILKWMSDYPGYNFLVVWDAPGAKTVRQNLFPDYKGNREVTKGDSFVTEEGESLNSFTFQLDMIRNLLTSLGVDQVSAPNREADDVIGQCVQDLFENQINIILTSDRDMLQLVNHKTIVMTPEGKAYDRDKVHEEYGVLPDDLIQLRALLGDKSDNIPGLYRFRKAIAARLVKEYGGVESIYNNDIDKMGLTKTSAKKLKDFQDQALLNVELMSLIRAPRLDYVTGSFNENEIDGMCDILEFTSIRGQLLDLNKPKQGLLKFNELHTTD